MRKGPFAYWEIGLSWDSNTRSFHEQAAANQQVLSISVYSGQTGGERAPSLHVLLQPGLTTSRVGSCSARNQQCHPFDPVAVKTFELVSDLVFTNGFIQSEGLPFGFPF